MKTQILRLLIALAWFAATSSLHASVFFTNLVFFTYTNPPNYGWNSSAPGHTSAMVQGKDGDFYGTTYEGGANYLPLGPSDQYDTYGYGTVFKMSPGGVFTSLYSFGSVANPRGSPGGDGQGPVGNLIKGSDGNLYGTTEYGGNVPGTDNGTIYQITANGSLSTLYSFGSQGFFIDGNFYAWPEGRFPFAGVTQGSDGNFYGTTTTSGAGDQGAIYQLTPGGNLNVLYSFPSDQSPAFATTGGMPCSELTEGSDRNFYGTTYWGGSNNCGTIFEITPGGTFTTLYSFGIPGYFGYIGANPMSPMILGKDGNFYGVANCSGNSANGDGIIFRFATNGAFTILHKFNLSDGSGPNGLVQGSDGNFYGTAGGGTYPYYAGTVFEITTNGAFTNLYFFSGPDGAGPGPLVQGADGSFFGTTEYGGPSWYDPLSSSYGKLGYGTVFKITIPPVFQSILQTNGRVSLAWNAMSNQVCQVQYSTNLVSTNWINLGNTITATNSPVSISDAAADAQRFYRIKLMP